MNKQLKFDAESFIAISLSALMFLFLLSLLVADNTAKNRIERLDIEINIMQERIECLEQTRRL